MKRRSGALIVLLAVSVGACSGSDDGGERVAVDDLFDLEQELPDDVSGVGLGDDGPSTDLTFCEAWATAPARWLNDAIIPLQYAVDAWGAARQDVPPDVRDDYDLLVAFGEAKIAWNFKQRDDRQEWTSTEAAAALAVADAAVATCDDLPLVATFADPVDRRPVGDCEEDAAGVRAGVEWYTSTFGEPPHHQQQIERAADLVTYEAYEETGEIDLDEYYYTSDVHGVASDGSGDVLPVPGGPCDV